MTDYIEFETSMWSKMSHDQRVDALQGLENSMAAEQGRPPRNIKASDLPPTRRGQYSPKDPSNLQVNNSLINSSDGNYQAMQTTIHEGRHAYQDDCVTGIATPQPQDKGKVETWSHNMPGRGGVYNNADKMGYPAYRYQPIESDANSYAKDKLNSIGSQYSQDPAFRQFCAQRDAQDRYSEAVAKNTYGNDYEQVIKQDIDKRYQAKTQEEGKGKTAQDKNGDKNMFDFKKDKAQRQQSSLSSSQHSSQDEAKAFRQSLKVDTSEQQQVDLMKASSQSSSSTQSGTSSVDQRESAQPTPSSDATKYTASAKISSASKYSSASESNSKGGQER